MLEDGSMRFHVKHCRLGCGEIWGGSGPMRLLFSMATLRAAASSAIFVMKKKKKSTLKRSEIGFVSGVYKENALLVCLYKKVLYTCLTSTALNL